MAAPLSATPGDTLDRDIACLSCGYNLRGLAPNGSCPECGRAIADSLRGGRLPFADPLWIDRVANGAGWLAVGQLVSVFSCDVSGAEPVTIFLFEAVPVGILLLGVWRFTTPRSRHSCRRAMSTRGDGCVQR
jgi:hypothetical protein